MVSPADIMARLDAMDARQLELGNSVQSVIEMQREQERLRGLKPIRWVASNITAASSITLGTTGPDSVPVESGYVWDLRVVAGKLSASDSVALYVGESANGRLIGYQAAPGAAPGQNVFVILIPKSSAILNAGETLFLQTSGAGNISSVNINAWEAPGPMVGKLF